MLPASATARNDRSRSIERPRRAKKSSMTIQYRTPQKQSWLAGPITLSLRVMRHSNLRSNHRETAVFTETRLALDTAFLPERLVLPPTTSSIDELLELAESYARDADRIRAEASRALARSQ